MKNFYSLLAILFVAHISFGQSIFKENFEQGIPGQFTQNYVNGTLDWDGNYANVNMNANNPFYSGDSAAIFYVGSYSADETELISPVINMAGGVYYLDFWHVQEDWAGDQNTLAIFVSNNSGSTWTRIDSITGNVANWTNRNYLLNSYISLTATMRIKYKGYIDYGYGVGVDSVDIYAAPQDDIGASALLAPTTGCNLTSNETVQVEVTNFGSDTAQNFTVSYKIGATAAITESFAGMILPGAKATHTFSTNANLGTAGAYNFKCYTTYAADVNLLNDTIANQMVVHHVAGALVKTDSAEHNIPDSDGNGVESSQFFCGLPTSLDGCFKIKSLTIDSLWHTYASDLNIFLVSPWNDTVEVSTNNGGSGANYRGAVFTDTSTNSITNITGGGVQPGYYRVEEAAGLSKFHTGQDPNGQWTLWINDDAGSDTGSVHRWTLEFEQGNIPVVNLRNDTTICNAGGTTVFLDAGFGAGYKYTWSNAITTQTQTVTGAGLGVGVHVLYVDVDDTVSQCRGTDTIIVTVAVCTDIPKRSELQVQTAPNPADNQVRITLLGAVGTVSWELYNVEGKLISANTEKGSGGLVFDINTNELKTGLYMLKIKDDQSVISRKLLIQH